MSAKKPMNLVPNSWGSELVEFNPCHRAADGKFGARAECGQAGALTTYKSPDHVKAEFRKGWGGDKDKTYYTYEEHADEPNALHYSMQLKGRPLTKEERAQGILYHVTTDLDAVISSGKLLAVQAGHGLGGGNHPAVSFTTDRKAALNILHVMATAKLIVSGAPFEPTLRAWSKRELATVVKKYGGYDNVPIHILDKAESAITEAVRTFKFGEEDHAQRMARNLGGEGAEVPKDGGWAKYDRDTRARNAMDAFRTYLWGRESAGLGSNPVFFTSGPRLRDHVKTVGIIAIATRHIPEKTLANLGADQFQGEVEVHGDVPIWNGWYTTRGELRHNRRRR